MRQDGQLVTEIVSAAFGVSCARVRKLDQFRKATPSSSVVSSSRSEAASTVMTGHLPEREAA